MKKLSIIIILILLPFCYAQNATNNSEKDLLEVKTWAENKEIEFCAIPNSNKYIIEIKENSNIDFSIFNELTKQQLSCMDRLLIDSKNFINADFSYFSDLTELKIDGPITDIKNLHGEKIELLWLENVELDDLSFLSNMASLKNLRIFSEKEINLPDMSACRELKDVVLFYENQKEFKNIETIPGPYTFHLNITSDGRGNIKILKKFDIKSILKPNLKAVDMWEDYVHYYQNEYWISTAYFYSEDYASESLRDALLSTKWSSQGIINDTRVRLRTDPNLDCETITFLNKGDKCTIFDFSHNVTEIEGKRWCWYKIETKDGKSGWVYGKYVDIDGVSIK